MKTVDQVIDKMNSTSLICQDENGEFKLRDIGDGSNVITFYNDASGLIQSIIQSN